MPENEITCSKSYFSLVYHMPMKVLKIKTSDEQALTFDFGFG